LYITKGEGVEVDKKNAQQGWYRREAFQVEQDEEEQYDDARYFDGGTACHPVGDVIEKIDEVAGHSQHNEGIELPESGFGIFGKVWRFLVIQLF
jgi:hypothetical protein